MMINKGRGGGGEEVSFIMQREMKGRYHHESQGQE